MVPLLHSGKGLSESLTSFLAKFKSFSAFIRFELKLIIELCQVLGFLLGLAMRSVVLMALGELADISFPAKILTIDERDGLVCLFVCLVLFVSIEPRRRRSIRRFSFGNILLTGFLLGLVGSYLLLVLLPVLSLDFCLLDGLCGDLVLGGDDGDLYSIGLSLDRDGLLHVVVGLLLGVEAHDFMLGHTVSLFARGWNCLHETDHCLVALRVKLTVISGLH